MRLLAVLVLAAACGGGNPKPAATPPPSAPVDPIPHTEGPACAVVADKLAPVVFADDPDGQAKLGETIRTRCSEDEWSDEARSCFATVENDQEVDGCMQQLTEAQRAAFKSSGAATGAATMPAAAPGGPAKASPLPKPNGGTRGPAHKSSSDPCEGGEATGDPEQGGEKR